LHATKYFCGTPKSAIRKIIILLNMRRFAGTRRSPPLGAALEILPLENQTKNSWVPRTQKKTETKKQASQANRTTRDNPEIAYF
jgi:hypothetical protein